MKHPLFDPLRGIAALWVVAYHLAAGSPAVQRVPLVGALAGAGFLGVPMFFVISGFCLASAARRTLEEGKSAADFMGRRLWRIFPPFWCSVLLAACFVPAVDWLGTLTLASIFDPSQERVLDRFKDVNSPYWSLAIEVQFYAVVALALCWRRRFFLVLLATTALSLAAWLSPPLLRSGAFLAFWMPFAFGVALHEALRAGWKPTRLRSLSSFVLLLIALFVTLRGGWAYGFHPSGFTAGQPNATGFAALFALFLWLAHDWDFGKNATLLAVGAKSYSVYLVHEPLRPVLESALRPLLGGNVALFGVAVMAGILAASWLFHFVCERPFLATGRRPEPRSSHAAPDDTGRRAAALT